MALSKTQVNRAGERMVTWWQTSDKPTEQVIDDYLVIDEWRGQHAYPLKLCMPTLRNWVAQASSLGITPAQRLKRVPRILNKLERYDGMKLARMQDIAGARAVLGTPEEVEAVAAKIRRNWSPRVSDYREHARPDTGYRGLHLMVEKRERIVEIQLRTTRQHTWAEEIERTDARLGYLLKDGFGPPDLLKYFGMASELLWLRDNGRLPPDSFVTGFREIREQVRPYFSSNPS